MNIFTKPIEFLRGVTNVSGLPASDLPEICFIGRSNVGKSSLVNALFNNNKLARTSRTPGCTQQLNFFLVKDIFMMVDIPGYGYAKASKNKIKNWNELILDYLKGRPQLQRVYMLLDPKVGLKSSDEEVLKFLDNYGIPCQLILTKIDKLNREELDKSLTKLKQDLKTHANCLTEILPCSSAKGYGLPELKKAIYEYLKDLGAKI